MTEPTLAQASPEITAAQEAIVGAFSLFDDWTDRYQYIIDLGKKLPDLRPEQKTEEHRLKGCQSQVWMVAEARDGRLYYEAISDSSIVSGLIALLLKVYSGPQTRRYHRHAPRFHSRDQSRRTPLADPQQRPARNDPADQKIRRRCAGGGALARSVVLEFVPDLCERFVVVAEKRDELRVELFERCDAGRRPRS